MIRARKGSTTLEYAIVVLLIINIIVSGVAVAYISGLSSSTTELSNKMDTLTNTMSTNFQSLSSSLNTLTAQLGSITGVVQNLTKPPTPGEAFTQTEIKIGLVEPLSGGYAVFGTEAKQVAELLIEDINNKGGIHNLKGARLVLVAEDSKSTVDGAKLAAQRLVSVEHVPIIVGAYISRHTGGMLEVTEPEKVIIVTDALVDYLTEKGNYIFRVCPKNSAHAVTNVNFIYTMLQNNGIDPSTVKIAIINEDSIFGKLGALAAQERATTLGMQVVDHIEYPYDITDMTSIVNRLMQEGVDIVISHPYFQDALLFARTVHDLDWHPMFIAGQGAVSYTHLTLPTKA